MKNPLILLFSIAICITSCKKEKKTSTPPPTTESVTPITTTTNTSTAPLEVLALAPCNGFLSTKYYIRIAPTFSFSLLEAQASFSKMSREYPEADTLTVKNLGLNGDSLSFLYDANHYPMYYRKDNLKENLKDSWELTGANGIPSFTFINTMPPPFADLSKIPDTLKMSQATLTINNLSNATSAVLILSPYGQSGQNLQLKLGGGNNKTLISKSDLEKLGGSNGLLLLLLMENVTYKNFGGKNFKFSKSFQYERQLVAVP